MEKILDVFGVVKGSGWGSRLGDFLLVGRLSRVDSFENAQSPEVGKGYLELSHSLSSGDVIFGLAGCT